jgi:hypothetical protein
VRMNGQESYTVGRDRAPIRADGSIGFYREILTADGRELIGREYPDEGYCWFNLTRAALEAGFSHDYIWNAERAARDLYLNPAYIEAHRAELSGVRS